MEANASRFSGVPKQSSAASITNYLGNNDHPHAAAVTEINALLSQSLAELKKKEGEIQILEQTLKAVEAECETLRKSAQEYDRIRAPVRRLPPDLLDEIFYHCLPVHRNPVMSCEEAPLLLISVCHSWRSAALSLPRLWARLHIPVYHVPTEHPETDNGNYWQNVRARAARRLGEEVNFEKLRDDARNAMQFRQHVLKNWLSRSTSYPLSISLFWEESDVAGHLDEEWILGPIIQIFELVFSMSSRIAELELTTPFAVFRQSPFWNISLDRVPSLRRLRVCWTGFPSPDISQLSILQAPSLQSLAIERTQMISSPFYNALRPENLSSLSLHMSMSVIAASNVLRRCHRLNHCQLTLSEGNIMSPGGELQETIFLPDLVTLSLSVDVITDGFISSFYENVYIPRLECFRFRHFVEWGHTPPEHLGSRETSGLRYLLERCSALSRLSLDSRYLTSEEAIMIFRSASQITHLKMGHKRRRQFSSASQWYWVPSDTCPWIDIRSLTLKLHADDNNRRPEGDDKGKARGVETLLPKLQVFQCHDLANVTTDMEVKDFILSRTGASAHLNGVSRLKRVEMTFVRKRQLDVAVDISGEVVAEDLQLDLSYDLPIDSWADEAVDNYSPMNGLNQWDTWNILA